MQRDKGWLECAEKLERLRDELHSALRSAAFSFSSMQRLEEDRGCLICIDSMPSYSGSLVPTVYLSSTEATVASDCDDGVNSPTSTAHETIRRWHVTTSSCIGESDSMVAETSLHVDDCVAKHNVLHYFRSCPSKEMMECQRLYQLVVSHALGVVQAQCDLWEAAGVVDATNAAA